MPRVYIFECNDLTEGQCFELSLFGSNRNWPLYVHTGDLCFLFNYKGARRLIYGVYAATCNGKHGIVAEAWSGDYPWQVRVKLCSRERIAVPRANIDRFVTNSEGYVSNVLDGAKADELLDYFAGGYTRGRQAGQRADSFEEDFRLRYPRTIHCTGG